MKILTEVLSDSYYKKMNSLLERDKLSIKKWNLIQKKLWQQLVDDNYVSKNDVNAFYAFAKFFDDYFQKTGHIIDYGRTVAYIGGY